MQISDRLLSLHVNFVRHIIAMLHRIDCPTCKKKTYATAFYQEWYGWDTTCLRCGEEWQDGKMSERPFERGWRTKRIIAAKKHYRAMTVGEQDANK
jgi:hypothetical protein